MSDGDITRLNRMYSCKKFVDENDLDLVGNDSKNEKKEKSINDKKSEVNMQADDIAKKKAQAKNHLKTTDKKISKRKPATTTESAVDDVSDLVDLEDESETETAKPEPKSVKSEIEIIAQLEETMKSVLKNATRKSCDLKEQLVDILNKI